MSGFYQTRVAPGRQRREGNRPVTPTACEGAEKGWWTTALILLLGAILLVVVSLWVLQAGTSWEPSSDPDGEERKNSP